MRSDMLCLWFNSQHEYLSHFGIDQKYKLFSNYGRNQTVVISTQEYEELIIQFRK